MNKIIYILCSALFLSLTPESVFSQEKNKTLKVLASNDTLRIQHSTDTIKRKLAIDSIQTVGILKQLIEVDSVRQKLKTDTIGKKVQLDSVQTKKLLEKFMSDILKQKKKTKKDIEYEVDGLIIARTISRAGRDFYDIFFSKWEPPKGIKNYIIEIIEKPHPQMGTEVTILIKEMEVFKERIQPRYDVIEMYVEYALYEASHFLNNFKEIEKELNGEDLSGSGIF